MELEKVTGMVLASVPIGEHDRRVVLLTRENGKFTAFARGARRQNSALLAATTPFAFGSFFYYGNRSSNTIVSAEIDNFFPRVREDLEAAYYGMYFLELADYYTREYNDEVQVLKLLYQTVRAITNEHIPKRLVRCIFEWKMLVLNGEYPNVEEENLCDTTKYTLQFITLTPVEKLYTFTVKEEVLIELEHYIRNTLAFVLDRQMKSLVMLESILND